MIIGGILLAMRPLFSYAVYFLLTLYTLKISEGT